MSTHCCCCSTRAALTLGVPAAALFQVRAWRRHLHKYDDLAASGGHAAEGVSDTHEDAQAAARHDSGPPAAHAQAGAQGRHAPDTTGHDLRDQQARHHDQKRRGNRDGSRHSDGPDRGGGGRSRQCSDARSSGSGSSRARRQFGGGGGGGGGRQSQQQWQGRTGSSQSYTLTPAKRHSDGEDRHDAGGRRALVRCYTGDMRCC